MSYNNIRDYEVSVWTLQDSFITVLKGYGDENKGQIQKPNMGMKNDGTLTLTFSLPMYLYIDAEKIENPKWYNVHNGTICADLRKIKVIFNKRETYEGVFEFVITRVTESHEKLQTWCEVECEALVFHELGRNGYKLSFHPEDFYTEWDVAQDKNNFKANINYWMDKVIANTEWQYEVAMTWGDYCGSRSATKIYEDNYVSSWSYDSTNDIYVPQNVITDKEKERLIDIEESNRYNIIQEIAEKFGVFVRFEYQYDNDYHIIGKKVIFYNVAINESNPLTIHYSYNTDDIEREMDGTDTITKMYIKSLSDSYTESGYATIMDTSANKSGEDYLLNFDYLHEIKTITDEQYEYVKTFEKRIKRLNEQIKPLQQQLIYVEEQITDKEAKKTFYENAVSLDKERISSNNKLLNNLTNGTGYITIDNSRPDMLVFLYEAGKNKSKINIRQKGVYPASVKIYTSYNTSTRVLSNQIPKFIRLYDESSNLIGVEVPGNNEGYAYLTYKYSPRFYYENIITTWERRLAQDSSNLGLITREVNNLNSIKENLDSQISEIAAALEQERSRFDALMGPAIREGYWQPEDDYEKYGDRYSESLTLNTFSNNLCSMGWDDKLFDDEMKNYYENGINQDRVYYPCINLSSNLGAFSNKDLSKVSFIYKELTNAESGSSITDHKFIQVDSGCFFRFLKHKTSGTIIPVLMLTDTSIPSDISDDSKDYNPYIGIVSIQVQNDSPDVVETIILNNNITKTLFISSSDLQNYKIVYPRIQIQSANLKTAEDQFSISDSNGVLKNYYDYYLLSRSGEQTPYVPFFRNSSFMIGLTNITNTPYSYMNNLYFCNLNNNIYTIKKLDVNAHNLITLANNDTKDNILNFLENLNTYIDGLTLIDIDNNSYSINDASETYRKNATQANIILKTYITVNYVTGEIKCFKKVNDIITESTISTGFTYGNVNYYAALNSNYVFSNKVKNINNYICNFILSNSSLFIYLDAIKVLNENAYPKAEYTIATTLVDEEFMKTAYNALNKLVHIYDLDLKFNGIQGYISELDLDLDKPWEDKITIANYKTKFEDLFSNIVVQTEEMKKNAAVIDAAARVFTIGGAISEDAMQQSINKADLNYAFNNGSLTIDENNGIWGTSDSGVVAMRGGGIFTATEKDDDGNWIWNTGILPSGINADLITTGQLDTNLIRIYAGDDLKLQMNGNGLFAYRDLSHMGETASGNSGNGLDYGQYVVHNGDGLFLRAEQNTEVNNNTIQIGGTDYNIIDESFNFNCYNGDLIFVYFPSEVHALTWFTDSLVLNYRLNNNKYYEIFENEPDHWVWQETNNNDYIQLMDYIIDYFSDYSFLENKVVAYLRYNYTNTESVIINKLLKNYSYDYVIWIKPSTQIISIYYLENNKIIKKEYGKLNTNIDRVAITWDGLTLRNWNNERTLWADADTGDLHIKGNLDAATGTFSGELSAATGTFSGELSAATGSFTGTLTANTGSNIAGWRTTNNAIYKNNSSFGNANGLYFGDNGLSIGNAFKVHATKSGNNYNFDYFTLGTPDSSNLYPLSYQYDANSSKYILSLNNVEFSESTLNIFNSIAEATTIANNNIYTVTSPNDLPTETEDGSLGIVYNYSTPASSQSQSSTNNTTFSAAATDVLNPTPGSYIYSGTAYTSGSNIVFGFTTSNSSGTIFYNSQKAHAKEQVKSGFENYYRAGRGKEDHSDNPTHDNASLAAVYFKVQGDNLPAGSTIQLNFTHSSDIVSGNPDQNCTVGGTRNPINIYFLSSSQVSSKPIISNSSSFANSATFTTNTRVATEPINKTISITTTKQLTVGDILWIVFFSDEWETLAYINLKTISLVNPNFTPSQPSTTTPAVSPIGLYVKNNNQWELAADGSNNNIYYNSVTQGYDNYGNYISNTSTNLASSAKIVYGTAKIISGGIDCNFGITFTNLPMVFCQIYAGSNMAAQSAEDYVVQVRSVTTTKFCADIPGASYSSLNPIQICWIAIGT